MEKRLQNSYEDTFAMYQRLVSSIKWANNELINHATDPEYCVDVGFVMNEMNKLLHDIGIEVRKTLELAEMLACHAWLRSPDEQPIRTEHCTATPRLKMQPSSPPRNSPEEKELLDWVGVARNHEVVRLHWPSLCNLVTTMIEKGERLPSCIDISKMNFPETKLTFFKRKEVCE